MSEETQKPQNPTASQTPRRIVRKTPKPSDDLSKKSPSPKNSPKTIVSKTQTPQKSIRKECQSPKNIQKNEDTKIAEPQINEKLKEKELQIDSRTNSSNDDIAKKLTEAISKYVESGTIVSDFTENKKDGKIEGRKSSFKPTTISKSNKNLSFKVKCLAKVDSDRIKQIPSDLSSTQPELKQFTEYSSHYPCKSIPLTQSYNPFVSPPNQVSLNQNNELISKIQFLVAQISFVLNNSKSCNSSGQFEPINMNLTNLNPCNSIGPFITNNSNLHDNIPCNLSGQFNSANSNISINKRQINSRKFKQDNPSNFNNSYSHNSHKYNIVLNLNKFHFNKLQRLITQLRERLVYDKLSLINGIMKTRIWCKSLKSIKTIKMRAHKWILYRVKESSPLVQNNLASAIYPNYPNQTSTADNSCSTIVDSSNSTIDPSKLSTSDWKIKKCLGDGNCLFRALANQIFGKQSYHSKVRMEIAEYMLKNKAHYTNFIDQCNISFEEYINALKSPGTWGDNTEIDAASKLYKKHVLVYNYAKNDKFFRLKKAFIEEANTDSQPIRLLHSENHFDAIAAKVPELMTESQKRCIRNFLQTKTVDSSPTANPNSSSSQ